MGKEYWNDISNMTEFKFYLLEREMQWQILRHSRTLLTFKMFVKLNIFESLEQMINELKIHNYFNVCCEFESYRIVKCIHYHYDFGLTEIMAIKSFLKEDHNNSKKFLDNLAESLVEKSSLSGAYLLGDSLC